jgi:hypothetical protein
MLIYNKHNFNRFNNKSIFVKTFEGLTEHGNSMRLASIMNLFRSGKRLTNSELNFLRRHAPEAYSEAARVLRQREFMEKQMRNAQTKQDVATVRAVSLTSIANKRDINANNAETKLAQVNHVANAYYEYSRTECYRRKPDGGFRRERYECRGKRNRDRFERG